MRYKQFWFKFSENTKLTKHKVLQNIRVKVVQKRLNSRLKSLITLTHKLEEFKLN